MGATASSAHAGAVVVEDPHAAADRFVVRLIVTLCGLAFLALVFTGVAQ
jgi:hypothetical protein